MPPASWRDAARSSSGRRRRPYVRWSRGEAAPPWIEFPPPAEALCVAAVTDDERFTGGRLVRASRRELLGRPGAYGLGPERGRGGGGVARQPEEWPPADGGTGMAPT
ncbi:hypothetical protein [Streptomyces griseoaurantiacus]|uniref:hypothetical protein n=1 Tax=Streptomyces griseoaurantiacus TaxID=68213 RepID=UPI0030E1BA3A